MRPKHPRKRACLKYVSLMSSHGSKIGNLRARQRAGLLPGGDPMKVAHQRERWIGYRLNILGIRVWENDCQLVAKTRGDLWGTIGARRPLPVHIPQTVDELRTASVDSLRITAYQYAAAERESDIVQVLCQEKDFDVALRDKVDKFVDDTLVFRK